MTTIDKDVMERAQFVYDAYSCFCENESDDLKRIDGGIEIIAHALQSIRNEEREACAKIAEEYDWALPFYDDPEMNEATDDTACAVQEGIATATRTRGE